MDDVGIDQMKLAGYGGEDPPATPTIDQIAGNGIQFHNAWSMPACSTSRAVFYSGRYPLRTNVLGALGPSDLANSMISPYEMTVPKLLALRGYQSGLFGKFHIGLQGNDPAGYAMPLNVGWSYYAGWLDETGDPSSIDTSAGGVAPVGTWSCGFVPGAADGGADSGACYFVDGTCRDLASRTIPPGRTCRDEGGILDPGQSCQASPPSYVSFQTLSGHYVNPLVINYEDGSVDVVPPTDPRARRFRASDAVDYAIEWIDSRPAGTPWMATVAFASAHTPLMQPPVDETDPENVASSGLDCLDQVAQRGIQNLMIDSIDTEIRRLLVTTGIADLGPDGELIYDPVQSNTMIVILGDNGTLGATVKLPFDPSRAKGTAYQTGVWVPMVVAGPLVREPNRVVSHMVNIVDLYELFGEIAGIEDVRAVVPRPIDSEPMMPYLRDPDHPSIRTTNFTQVGPNLQANGSLNGPCTISNTCTQIPVTKGVCEDNAGIWWGEGHDDPITDGIPADGYDLCCEVIQYVVSQELPTYSIAPLTAVGIRSDRYKIVQNSGQLYVSQEQPCVQTTTTELYEIDESIPVPRIDEEGLELPLDALTPEQQRSYDFLAQRLEEILSSQPPCTGDGNIDGIVNDLDLEDWAFYERSTGLSSWYDINLDGLTNDDDRHLIAENLGTDCRR